MERTGNAQRVGTYDVEGSRGLEEVFDAVPAAPFADRVKELRLLERPDVVADALAGELERPGDTCG